MRIKPGFELRDICGEKAVIAVGIENVDFNRIISLNETAAYLWEAVRDTDFDAQTLADLLTGQYEVDPQTALRDAAKTITDWESFGLLLGCAAPLL